MFGSRGRFGWRKRSEIESRKSKLNRETMLKKPLLFKSFSTNENRSKTNRFVRMYCLIFAFESACVGRLFFY